MVHDREPVDASEIRKVFGILLTCGLHPRELLREYSMHQVGVLAAMVAEHRMDMLNTLLEPVVKVMGGEWKSGTTSTGGTTKKSRPPRRKSSAPSGRTLNLMDVEEKNQEAALMQALLRASHQGVRGGGVSIRDVKPSPTDDPTG